MRFVFVLTGASGPGYGLNRRRAAFGVLRANCCLDLVSGRLDNVSGRSSVGPMRLDGTRPRIEAIRYISEKSPIGALETLPERNPGAPSERSDATDVHQLLRSSIRFRGIEFQIPVEAHDLTDQTGKFADANVRSRADVEVLIRAVVFHREDARIREIVDMQEFASRPTCAPDLDSWSSCEFRKVRLDQKGRDDMARGEIVGIVRAIEV
jgi:hypothetical protein